MATMEKKERVPDVDYDPAYPFKAPCEVVSCTSHSFSGDQVDSLALMVRHAYERRKEGSGIVRLGAGRVVPSPKVLGYTYFHVNLVGDQIGPLLGFIGDGPEKGQGMVGRWVMLCGTPFMGCEDHAPDGKKCNLLYLRDAHVFVIAKPEGA